MAKPASRTITRKIELDDRTRCQHADAASIALDIHALVTAHHADDIGKDRRLDQSDEKSVEVNRLVQLAHEYRNGHSQIEIAHHGAADQAHQIGVKREKRKCDHQADHAWKDQNVDEVEAHGLHGVELFIHLHRADLSGEG